MASVNLNQLSKELIHASSTCNAHIFATDRQNIRQRANCCLETTSSIIPLPHSPVMESRSSDIRRDLESGEANTLGNKSTKTLDALDEQRRRPTFWYILAIISLLLIGAMIAVGVVVAGNKNSNEALTTRQQELSDIVASISDPATLADTASPQAKARHWLVHDDDLWVDEAGVLVAQEMAVQRYALAVFYFATSGPSWIAGNNWLQGQECNDNTSWTGITCNTDGKVRALALGKYLRCKSSRIRACRKSSANLTSSVASLLLYFRCAERQGLAGTIPSEIGQLSELENFILKNEVGLTGTIPSSIGKLRNLRQLGLSHGNLVGPIPAELFLVTTLTFLDLEANAMSGTLSKEVSKLRALQTLVLSNNSFQGTIPFDSLASTNLEYLALSSNAFEGGISDAIRDMKSLQYLYLDSNEKIVGELPVALGSAENLRSINLDYTAISGRVPAVIGRLRNLEYLSMQGCKLQGSIPGEINLLTKLKTLNLDSNALTGDLPDLSPMTSLSSLMLVGNRLRGNIEDAFADLHSLELLFLTANEFTGPIPAAIGRPAGTSGSPLRGLYLSDNKLDGSIPVSICDYAKLEALFVDKNQLTGSIPSCMGNLKNLKQLYAFDNQLTGEVL